MLRWDKSISPARFRARLMEKGVILYGPSNYFEGFVLVGNETISRIEPNRLAALFAEAAR